MSYFEQSTVLILNLDYFLSEIGYYCTFMKSRTAAHSWVDPHTIDSLFVLFPSDNETVYNYDDLILKVL